MLRRAFARMGWIVHTFRSAGEAIDALGRGPEPCCVLIDDPRPEGRRAGEVLERAAALGYRSRLVIRRGRPASLEEYRPGEILPRAITAESIWGQACPVCDPPAGTGRPTT
jgi:hypothetical protein